MPIVKRSAIPFIAKGGRRADGDFPARPPGRPLSDILKELRVQASDADWTGRHAEARELDQRIEQIKARLDAGELYEVDF